MKLGVHDGYTYTVVSGYINMKQEILNVEKKLSGNMSSGEQIQQMDQNEGKDVKVSVNFSTYV